MCVYYIYTQSERIIIYKIYSREQNNCTIDATVYYIVINPIN